MATSKAAPGFPHDHLAVLGFKKLKRYVPTENKMDQKLTVTVDPDGTTRVSNDRTEVLIMADGTVEVSSEDPVKLTGACSVKLDDPRVARAVPLVLELLAKRLRRKS